MMIKQSTLLHKTTTTCWNKDAVGVDPPQRAPETCGQNREMETTKCPIRYALGKLSPSWLIPLELSITQPVPPATLLGPHTVGFPQSHQWLLLHASQRGKKMSVTEKCRPECSNGRLDEKGWYWAPHATAHKQRCASPTTMAQSAFLVSFFSFQRVPLSLVSKGTWWCIVTLNKRSANSVSETLLQQMRNQLFGRQNTSHSSLLWEIKQQTMDLRHWVKCF